MSDDLVTWLRAQLDDDEQMLRSLDSTALNGIDSTAGWDVRAYVERGRAEVDAKRRILDYFEYERIDVSLPGGPPETLPGRRPATAGPVLRLLALPYADRPGHRDEWAPDA